MADDTARAVIAARASYGKLLSWLAQQWRDVAAAEDALAEAFVAALQSWPVKGIPRQPEAWLLTAARRNLLKGARRHRMDLDPQTRWMLTQDEAMPDPVAIPDTRLRLMFVCAHPAIDPPVRTALMLQTVLGVDAARIARLFLVSAEAMTKRLVRAKAKIRMSGLRFAEPEPGQLAPRLHAVLEAIYAAYTLHDAPALSADAGDSLAEEALWLAALVRALLPAEPEAAGLEALLTFCEARRPARMDAAGDVVPLLDQDPALWDAALIARGNAILTAAAEARRPGPFQIEAAIQAAHCHRAVSGRIPWDDIATLYAVLLDTAPTTGARLGHAVAVAQATGNPAAGLRLLDTLDAGNLAAHQPFWAVRGWLHEQAGEAANAAAALWRARALSTDPALQRHLDRRIAALTRT